ncbi:MAG: hypothetical protein DMD33_02565 [Gemmatimonadetes bacterium]|nr:MAG: hypothetical protein DMD33_02565 [Gemmatimonadota bacterium]
MCPVVAIVPRSPGTSRRGGCLRVPEGGRGAECVHLLRSGLVKISVVWRDGRELILRLARPGELFGKTSLGAPEHRERWL